MMANMLEMMQQQTQLLTNTMASFSNAPPVVPLGQPQVNVQPPVQQPVNPSKKSWYYKRFKDCNPPEFVGTTEPKVAKNFIRDLEKIFGVINCTVKEKVNSATFILQGEARVWWDFVKRMYAW